MIRSGRHNYSIVILLLCCSFSYFSFSQSSSPEQLPLCNKSIVGYWHTWQNASAPFIKLRDVPCYYNVVNLSFLEPKSASDATMHLTIEENLETTDEIIADIKLLKARGVKVLASIGGANGAVSLPNSTEKTKFITSIQAVIDKFGIEGIDIDIEGGLSLGSEDSDVKNPKSARMVNLIDAIKAIKTANGSNFWITMAPEVAYVQGGASSFSGIFGAYLPIIYSLQDILAYIHVQYYNTGGMLASDGNNYNQGTADFIVAMNDMLLSGFKMSNGTMFPALREDQVSFGIPAINGAAGGGYLAMTEVVKALDYLTKGTSFNGKYKLAKTYPNLRGIMTWSINWDKSASYQFGKAFSNYFCKSADLCTSASVNQNSDRGYSLNIYPNPAADIITLSNNNTEAINFVEVYSISGAKIKTVSNPGNTLQIKDLTEGVYYLKFYSGNKIYINKLVKI